MRKISEKELNKRVMKKVVGFIFVKMFIHISVQRVSKMYRRQLEVEEVSQKIQAI